MDVLASLDQLAESLEKNAVLLDKAKRHRLHRDKAFDRSKKATKRRNTRVKTHKHDLRNMNSNRMQDSRMYNNNKEINGNIMNNDVQDRTMRDNIRHNVHNQNNNMCMPDRHNINHVHNNNNTHNNNNNIHNNTGNSMQNNTRNVPNNMQNITHNIHNNMLNDNSTRSNNSYTQSNNNYTQSNNTQGNKMRNQNSNNLQNKQTNEKETGWSPQWTSSDIASELELDERIRQLGDYRTWGNQATVRNTNTSQVAWSSQGQHPNTPTYSSCCCHSSEPQQDWRHNNNNNNNNYSNYNDNWNNIQKEQPCHAYENRYTSIRSHVDARTRQAFMKYPYPGYGEQPRMPMPQESQYMNPRNERAVLGNSIKVPAPVVDNIAGMGMSRESISKAEEALEKAMDVFEGLSSRLGMLEVYANQRGASI